MGKTTTNKNNVNALAALQAAENAYDEIVNAKREQRKAANANRKPRQHYDIVIDIMHDKNGKRTGGAYVSKIKPSAIEALSEAYCEYLKAHKTLRIDNAFKFLNACADEGKHFTVEFYHKYSKLYKGERKAKYYQEF